MGAHSNPSLHTHASTIDMTDYKDVVLNRDERGYLKEMLHTYRHMFAEVMTAQKFNNCNDKSVSSHQKNPNFLSNPNPKLNKSLLKI